MRSADQGRHASAPNAGCDPIDAPIMEQGCNQRRGPRLLESDFGIGMYVPSYRGQRRQLLHDFGDQLQDVRPCSGRAD